MFHHQASHRVTGSDLPKIIGLDVVARGVYRRDDLGECSICRCFPLYGIFVTTAAKSQLVDDLKTVDDVMIEHRLGLASVDSFPAH